MPPSPRKRRPQAFRQVSSTCWGWIGLLCLLAFGSGCQTMRGLRQPAAAAPIVFQQPPAGEELLFRLNQQALKVRQLQGNVSLEMPGTPRLTGTLLMERPDRLRLKAGVGGMSELGFDLGCNDDLFWVWNKSSLPGQPPAAIYYAYQRDLNQLQRMVDLPIDPQWIIDATGLVEFAPQDLHQGPFPDPSGRLKVNTIRATPIGNITRVAYIDPRSALIQQQAIYDSQNRLMAYTNASNFEYFAEFDVSLPRRIELNVVDRNGQIVKVAINASQFRLNSFYGNPDQTWNMPTPEGVRMINLAEGNFSNFP